MTTQINYPDSKINFTTTDNENASVTIDISAVHFTDTTGGLDGVINPDGVSFVRTMMNEEYKEASLGPNNILIKKGNPSTLSSTVNIFSDSLVFENYDNDVRTQLTTLDINGFVIKDPSDTNNDLTGISITGVNVSKSGEPAINSFLSCDNLKISPTAITETILNDTLALKVYVESDVGNQLVSTTTIAPASLSSDVPVFDMSFNTLTFQGVMGTEGQVLKSDASGNASWQNIHQPVIKTFAISIAEWNAYMSTTRIISGSIFIAAFSGYAGNDSLFLPTIINNGDYFIIVNRSGLISGATFTSPTTSWIYGGSQSTDRYVTLAPYSSTTIYYINATWQIMSGGITSAT